MRNFLADVNPFHLWLEWLRDLGGTYEPLRDLDEPKPVSGRRDPANKPRAYRVSNKTHYYDRNGSLRRRVVA
jgi:hypothetical protein